MKTINEVESVVPALLEVLRNVPLSPELAEAREYLLPKGFTPVVQLEEDGRKKRSSAAARNWTPTTGEIRIYFDPDVEISKPQAVPPVQRPIYSVPSEPSTHFETAKAISPSVPEEEVAEEVSPQEVIECCQALAAAERSNRQFIALKWFRDDFLATVDFAWAKSPHRRQRVLSHAIDIGRIDAKKIPNPKSNFPTTTISLNRSIPTPGVAPRFQPIAVRGEAVSTTLLRDRGKI